MSDDDGRRLVMVEHPALPEADRRAKLAVLQMAEDQIYAAMRVRDRLRKELGMAELRLSTAEALRRLTGVSPADGVYVTERSAAQMDAAVVVVDPPSATGGCQPCGCDPTAMRYGVVVGWICERHRTETPPI